MGGGGGVSQKLTKPDKGGGGVAKRPILTDVIYGRSLITVHHFFQNGVSIQLLMMKLDDQAACFQQRRQTAAARQKLMCVQYTQLVYAEFCVIIEVQKNALFYCTSLVSI